MSVPNSITFHPLWPELQPYVKDEPAPDAKGRKSRVRLELVGLPDHLARKALKMEVACVSCGQPIFPIRARRGAPKRGEEEHAPGIPKHLYIAVACPLQVSIGCSRGRAASVEYSRIENHMIVYRAKKGE